MTVMGSQLPLTRLEVFWAGLVLPSFAGSNAGFTVREGEVDYLAGLARFMGSASEKAKLGIRLAFFLAVTTPVWVGGRLRGFASLSPLERSEHLDAMSRHRIFLVRELCLLLKLIACMAIFRAPSTRARTGYDGDELASRPARSRRALPVLRQARTLEASTLEASTLEASTLEASTLESGERTTTTITDRAVSEEKVA